MENGGDFARSVLLLLPLVRPTAPLEGHLGCHCHASHDSTPEAGRFIAPEKHEQSTAAPSHLRDRTAMWEAAEKAGRGNSWGREKKSVNKNQKKLKEKDLV